MSYIENLFTVRRSAIRVWLDFLKCNHPQYSAVIIDEDILSSYPEDGPLPNIAEMVTTTNDSSRRDEVSESSIASDINLYEKPLDCVNQFQKSAIVDENGATIPMTEIYNYLESEMRANNKNSKQADSAIGNIVSFPNDICMTPPSSDSAIVNSLQDDICMTPLSSDSVMVNSLQDDICMTLTSSDSVIVNSLQDDICITPTSSASGNVNSLPNDICRTPTSSENSSTGLLTSSNNLVLEETIAMIPGANILDTRDPFFYPAAFPTLFPFGLGSPSVKRKKVSFDDIIQHMLLSKSGSSLRDDFKFMVTCYESILKKQIFHAISVQVNFMKPNVQQEIAQIKPDDIAKAIADRQAGYENSGLTWLHSQLSVVGSKAPFSQMSKKTNKQELKSFIINKCSSSLYVTISPNDSTNSLSYAMCLKDPLSFDSDKKEVSDKYFRSKQAAQNPVGLSMFFHVLITAIMRQLLGWNKDDKRGIFGNLNGYYGMVESQNRGTLHIHLLIWLEGYVRLFLSIFYG